MHRTPALLALLLSATAFAQAPDKSAYHLFNPTPREFMRDMSTDRPDSTESAYTVDAGHIQIELSFFEFEREDDGPRTDTTSVMPFNFKFGVFNNLDLQFLLTPYIREHESGAAGGSISGTGDLTIRAKINLIGNDSGDFALALMPFITIPSGDDEVSAGDVEGGLIIPWTFTLSEVDSLAMMLEFDSVIDSDGRGRHIELFHTISFARSLTDELGIFVEYAGLASFDDDGYEATFNTGLTYALTPDIQLDGGVRIGLTESAPDYAVFAGISLRF